MYSRVATVNISTADGCIFSSKETFLLLSNVIYPFKERVNIKFPPAECSSDISNEQLFS